MAGVSRGNGQVERLHSTVISALTKLSLDNPEKWYSYVASLQRILNNTFHRSVQMTPFELLVGTKMRTQNDVRIIEVVEEEFTRSFMEKRDELREEARQSIGRIQEENRKSYNKWRKKATQYAVNDLVAIERTQFGVGLKIKPKFLGPYRIVAVKSFDRYLVEKCGDHEGPIATTTSADKMKFWVNEEETTDCNEEDENEGVDPSREVSSAEDI